MRKTVWLAMLGMLCLTSVETEAAFISVGNHTASPGDIIDIPVLITGGENMANATVGFSVGDGGPVLSGTETVTITAVDHASGTVWGVQPITIVPPGPALPAASATIVGAFLSTSNVDVPATGLLTTFTLDLSTATVGEVLLLDPNAGSQTFLTDSGSVPLSLSFGTGTLTLVAVPEPSTLVLLVTFGVVGMAVYSRKRKRQTAA